MKTLAFLAVAGYVVIIAVLVGIGVIIGLELS